MKKTLKVVAAAVMAGTLMTGTLLTSFAASIGEGQWCQETKGWWYKLTEDGSKFLANTWHWIKDSDGVVRCYYFDPNGWLVTGTEVEGSKVNADGRWVDAAGTIQVNPDKDFYTTTILQKTSNAAAGTAAPTASRTASTTAKKGVYKSSGEGDSPNAITESLFYTNSSVSGSSVTSNFGKFAMTLQGHTPVIETTGAGTDWYVDDDSSLTCTYYDLGKYGNNIDVFVSSFLSDPRGMRGGKNDGNVTLGAFSFRCLSKEEPTPPGADVTYERAYIRQIDGTNYAVVFYVQPNGSSEDYVSSLNTLTRIG